MKIIYLIGIIIAVGLACVILSPIIHFLLLVILGCISRIFCKSNKKWLDDFKKDMKDFFSSGDDNSQANGEDNLR